MAPMPMTREQRSAYMEKYNAEHREEIRANHRYYYQRNKERIKKQNYEYAKAYRQLHRDEINAYSRAYYAAHKDDPGRKQKRREYNRKWRDQNREYWNNYYKEYRKRKALEGEI